MTQLIDDLHSITAFAPATCANLAVGFDILGLALEEVGDRITLTKRDDHKLVIEKIDSPTPLPKEIEKNTATVALQALRSKLGIEQGFSIHIQKGIPTASGMGGSAASAVAALVACNAFLNQPLSLPELAEFALLGEETASGQKHADNIIPCLFGGLTLIQSIDPIEVLPLPIPELICVLIHPHLQISTQEARKILKGELPLATYIKQSACLAGFIAALYSRNWPLLQKSYTDLLIEPQRASLIPGFYRIKEAALEARALGFSISGSGPSLLALARDKEEGKAVAEAIQNQLNKEKLASDCWIAPISKQGARITQMDERT